MAISVDVIRSRGSPPAAHFREAWREVKPIRRRITVSLSKALPGPVSKRRVLAKGRAAFSGDQMPDMLGRLRTRLPRIGKASLRGIMQAGCRSSVTSPQAFPMSGAVCRAVRPSLWPEPDLYRRSNLPHLRFQSTAARHLARLRRLSAVPASAAGVWSTPSESPANAHLRDLRHG